MKMYFDELDLSDELLDALWDMHFEECTPIQAAAIPEILDGHDIIACAQTGTGKTAAYILPLLNNLQNDNHDENKLNAIIMAPTRELAQQIDQQMQGFGYYAPFASVPVYGGNDAQAWSLQMNGLQKGADIIIATPGRLLSLLNIYDIDFSGVKYFIMDEADRMLDMGFFDDIMSIVSKLPKQRQTIMFSATMPNELRKLAKGFMNHPSEVNIAISRPPETIRQQAVICYETQKNDIINWLLTRNNEKLIKVIIFSGKKQTVKELTRILTRQEINARAMHSDLEQRERDEVMLDFRNGKIDVLVATDIVARGIDVEDIPLVINYDVPKDAEDYVHRIGRTARAENNGEAVTLVSENDQRYFKKIERFLHKDIEKLSLPIEFGEVPAYQDQEKTKKKHFSPHKRNGKKPYHKSTKKHQKNDNKSNNSNESNKNINNNKRNEP